MQLACSRKSNKCLIPGEHMFYFQQMFLNALDGIDTHGITNGVVGIASTILIISFLYGAYQAFSSGGDVRALGISGIKYLLLGLVFTSYATIFRDINTMFNSVAHSITSFVSAPDMFSNWMGQIQSYWMNNGTQSLWSIIGEWERACRGCSMPS